MRIARSKGSRIKGNPGGNRRLHELPEARVSGCYHRSTKPNGILGRGLSVVVQPGARQYAQMSWPSVCKTNDFL